MSHVFVRIIARYAPIVTFPVAVVLGFIGYNLEGQISNKSTPYLDHSINEEREKRFLNGDSQIVQSPTIFDKNDPSKLRWKNYRII